jgi:predicted GNAT family acetyltransferase
LVHPEFCGRGYGTAVVSAVVASAMADGKLLLYQTVESNRASVVIAERLGYRKYASYLAIRLK